MNISDKKYEIRGANDFDMKLEQYREGRIFYSSLGHVANASNVIEVIEIMKRNIKWTAESSEKDFKG